MDIDTEELAKTYAELADSELLRMHASGDLTEVAYHVLEKELTQRGISIPQRKDKSEVERGRPQSLRAHWEGRASLASAFWVFWILGIILISLPAYFLFKNQAGPVIVVIFLFVYLTYLVFAGVSVWRCAWNTRWKGWGYLARIQVLSWLIMQLAELIKTMF
jgi:hypothetical protein